MSGGSVVSYRNSTSNHNNVLYNTIRAALYLIEILHQTTTLKRYWMCSRKLYLIEILHQTTTFRYFEEYQLVVSYRNSTSNHNATIPQLAIASLYLIEILHQTTTSPLAVLPAVPLYLIEILHQTTTPARLALSPLGCILSKFYIKPQPRSSSLVPLRVVSYRNSTSNHNISTFRRVSIMLYLIEILHQTTTNGPLGQQGGALYLIEILHQTTTFQLAVLPVVRCILSKFYIKPQQRIVSLCVERVVSYRNSTSNHNKMGSQSSPFWLYLIEILHQTTTATFFICFSVSCILSKFYIKPQPPFAMSFNITCCILSKFYIKPQQGFFSPVNIKSCILSKFYIKPQRRASY